MGYRRITEKKEKREEMDVLFGRSESEIIFSGQITRFFFH
jgi:hypothetical protein